MAADTHLVALLLGLFCHHSAFSLEPQDLAFVENPQYSVALPGDSVYFSCKTNLPSNVENITWLHNGQPLRTNGKARGQLTFKVSTDPEVYKKQLGPYQCIGGASGLPYRLASLEAELSVAFLAEFRPSKKNETIQAFAGNDMVIPCQVPESVPPAFVQFAKDGLVLDEGRPILNGDTLLLTNVSKADGGNYSCIVTNHITNERKHSPNSVELTIEANDGRNEKSRLIYSPKDNYQVRQGEGARIPCTASGIPRPEIMWTKLENSNTNNASGLLVEHGVLVIKDAKRSSETEHYLCAVFNGAGRFVRRTSVTVLAPPKFESTPEKLARFDQEPLTLQCKASGSPPPRIQWLRNGRPIESPDLANPITGQLVISSMEESGLYQCFASNKVGQIMHSTFVQLREDAKSNPDDYDLLDEVEAVKSYEGYAITSPTRPNVTQLSPESAVITWDLQQPIDHEPVLPVKFFKIQFREFYRGKGRSQWHTLDDVISSDVRAFEVLGLYSDRKYRFRVVVVFENDDSKPGPLSRKFKMHANSMGLSAKPNPPSQSPEIVGLLPLGPTSLRVGWSLKDDPENVEGYFIYYKPSLSDEKYKKITILGATSHFYVLEALMPGTQYEIKVQAFNLAGPSPFSDGAMQSTVPLPPVSSAEVSEADSEPTKEEETNVDEDEKVIKYLILGGCLAGSLVLFILICSVVTYCHRRKKAALQDNLAQINQKYADTAVQISHTNLQSLADLGSRNQSYLSVTKECSNFEMTLLPGKNHSVSDSMFSSRQESQSAEINSLGQEEYNNEPSRKSWRRSRRSEESFI